MSAERNGDGATERSPLLSRTNQGNGNGDGDGDGNGTGIGSGSGSGEQGLDIAMPSLSRLGPICFAIWVPVFVASLDTTIVATLVGSISSSFNRSEQAAWLGSSYLLSVCCFTPIYGRLCDIMGRKYAMLLGLSFFSAGTLLCGLAPSMEVLIAARAIAGAGGGGLTTCTSTILSDIIPLRNRGLYQGMTNIIYGMGAGLGGPLGGLLNDTLGWRDAFLVQMPFLILSLALCFFIVPHGPQVKPGGHNAAQQASHREPSVLEKVKSIDVLGSLTLVGCVGSTLFSLSSMSADDRTIDEPIVWGGLLLGSISGILFVFVEIKIARSPILPMKLLTSRTGAAVAICNLTQSIGNFALLYNYPLILQAVRLESASTAGLHLIPNSITLSIGSVTAGLYMRRTGRYHKYNVFSAALIVVSMIWILFIRPKTPEWVTYAAVIPTGYGFASVLTCTLLALINTVPRSEIAVATGVSYLFRTTGQVVGVAVSGAILQSSLKHQLRKRIKGPGAEALITQIRHQSSIIPTLAKAEQKAAIKSYNVSLKHAFVFALCASLLTLASAYAMEDLKLPEVGKKPVEAVEEEEASSSSSS